MRKILSFLALAIALPLATFADADTDALQDITLTPVSFSGYQNIRLYQETAASLGNIRQHLTDLKNQGRVSYYAFYDLKDRLEDAAWRANIYFRALRDQEIGSRFVSADRRARLLGEMRQATDRLVARLPR